MAKKVYSTHKEYVKAMVDELAEQGGKLVRAAFNTREYTNRTFNLHDSYGSAVYYKGHLQQNSIRTMENLAKEPKKWYGVPLRGASEITDFLREYRGTSKGFELIVVAAMPYASILEQGEGNLKRKYKVISGIEGDMKMLASKYGGSVGNSSTSRIV